MFKRVPQPPMNPALRAEERHDLWPGLILAVAGIALALLGARHLTSLGTAEGGVAKETQLVMAFSSGGVQYASQIKPPPPPKLEGVADAAEVMDRWARQRAGFQPPTWKIRVDTSAKTPCPT